MTSTCADCHDKTATAVSKQFDRSVHAKNLADSFTCTTCHDPHLDAPGGQAWRSTQDRRAGQPRLPGLPRLRRIVRQVRSRKEDTAAHRRDSRLAAQCARALESGALRRVPHAGGRRQRADLAPDSRQATRPSGSAPACHSADSSLKTRLYRHLVGEERQRLGFANSVILANSYVLGATRHALLDTLLMIAFGAMLVGLLAHGVGRIVARRACGRMEMTDREYPISPWIRIWH